MPANAPPAPNSAPLNEAKQPHAPQLYCAGAPAVAEKTKLFEPEKAGFEAAKFVLVRVTLWPQVPKDGLITAVTVERLKSTDRLPEKVPGATVPSDPVGLVAPKSV
jgi:hypothetical protein